MTMFLKQSVKALMVAFVASVAATRSLNERQSTVLDHTLEWLGKLPGFNKGTMNEASYVQKLKGTDNFMESLDGLVERYGQDFYEMMKVVACHQLIDHEHGGDSNCYASTAGIIMNEWCGKIMQKEDQTVNMNRSGVYGGGRQRYRGRAPRSQTPRSPTPRSPTPRSPTPRSQTPRSQTPESRPIPVETAVLEWKSHLAAYRAAKRLTGQRYIDECARQMDKLKELQGILGDYGLYEVLPRD